MSAKDKLSGITAEYAREIFSYDPTTGVLMWRTRPKGNPKASLDAGGKTSKGYYRVQFGGFSVLNHRLIWLMVTGSWPADLIDHINGRRDDNRWVNLRESTRSLNLQNQRGPRVDNKSGFLGVCWHKVNKKFSAAIRSDGKQISLGCFSDPEEASRAYLSAKRKLHASCTI